jgi:hypothetical protein
VANGRIGSAFATETSLAGDHPDHPTQDSQWQVAHRYMSAETLAKTHVRVIDGEGEREVQELAAAG